MYLTGSVAQAETTILWPPDRQVIESEFATIVVDPDKSVTKVEVLVNGKSTMSKGVQHRPVCIPISLREGNSSIEVVTYTGVREESRHELTLFRKTLLDKKFRYPPKPFSKRFFHNPTNEALCSGCHDMSVNETPGVAFEEVNQSNCYTCHKGFMERRYLHAPTTNWLCATTCHDGKTGSFNQKFEGSSRFLYPDPIMNRCFECHEDFEHRYKNGKYHHEPVDDGRCHKCHDPHGSGDKRFLRKEPWELCTTCHTEKKTQPHVVTTFSGRGHPTRGKKIPKKPDEELSCISCHNPHVSNNGYMLRDYMGRGLILWCNRCHEKN